MKVLLIRSISSFVGTIITLPTHGPGMCLFTLIYNGKLFTVIQSTWMLSITRTAVIPVVCFMHKHAFHSCVSTGDSTPMFPSRRPVIRDRGMRHCSSRNASRIQATSGYSCNVLPVPDRFSTGRTSDRTAGQCCHRFVCSHAPSNKISSYYCFVPTSTRSVLTAHAW